MTTFYLVGQQRDISRLPPWRRYLVRFVYFVAGWHGASEVQFQTITSSELLARQIVGDKTGWFIVPLPVNECLPDEPVQYEEVPIYPNSDVSDRYAGERRPYAATSNGQMRAVKHNIDQIIKSAAAT